MSQHCHCWLVTSDPLYFTQLCDLVGIHLIYFQCFNDFEKHLKHFKDTKLRGKMFSKKMEGINIKYIILANELI